MIVMVYHGLCRYITYVYNIYMYLYIYICIYICIYIIYIYYLKFKNNALLGAQI